jgi:putative ABC transport system permease protein
MKNHKVYAITNVGGLSVGLAIAFLIVLYIQPELSYDNFHLKLDRLFRVSIMYRKEGSIAGDSPEFTPPIGPAMKAEFPEVDGYARVSTLRPAYLSQGDQAFKVEGIAFADSTLFDLFSFRLVAGAPRTALAQPFSIVLTEELARRFFGDGNPVGQTVKLDNDNLYTVTGVIQRPPENSSIRFDALISFSTLYRLPNLFMDWNGGNQYITYVLLAGNAKPEDVQRKFPDFMWKHLNKQMSGIGVAFEPHLQPLKDIHLHHNPGSDSIRTNLYVFGAIAILILFIACVNFVNLAMAQAVSRSKEVGVRKVLGASWGNLVRQFLGESLVLSGIAVVMAILLLEIVSSAFGEITGRNMMLASQWNVQTAGVLLAISLLVALGSGLYPAFYLSSMETVWTLKGGTAVFKKNSRNVLVVLQFAVSIALGVSTIVIDRQINFINTKTLGFEKENMLVLPLIGDEVQAKSEPLKAALSQVPGVVAVAASSDVPHNGFTSNGYFPEGSSSPMMIHVVDVDDAFLATYGIDIVQGRGFSGASSAEKDTYLINETLARTLNWNDPIGKTIRRNGDHEVIGVVRDFHFATLHERIEPLIVTRRPWLEKFTHLSVKVKPADLQLTLNSIKDAWAGIAPSTPFNYFFLDDAFDRTYKREQRFQSILGWSSLFAIVIASVGLLSLVALSVRQRTKEIGIRKVLGASVPGIISLISREYTTLVVAANLIAWPVAAYLMNSWLEDFAYRIGLPWWAFLLAGCAALAAALLAVGIQSLRAAMANPVEALRYE